MLIAPPPVYGDVIDVLRQCIELTDREKKARRFCKQFGPTAYCRSMMAGKTGYDAKVANELFESHPNVSVVLVRHAAATHSGFRILRKGSSAMLYYRKAGGTAKYPRPVQQRYVEAV